MVEQAIQSMIDRALVERLGPAIDRALDERLGPAIDRALDEKLGPAIDRALLPVMEQLGRLKLAMNQYVGGRCERKTMGRFKVISWHPQGQ